MENQILDENVSFEETPKPRADYAGFWIRVGATLVDLLVYLPFVGITSFFLFWEKNLIGLMISNVFLMVYKPFMEYRYGATLGKMAVKVKVVTKDLGKLSLNQTLIRSSPWIASSILSIISNFLLFQHPDFQDADGFMEIGLIQAEFSIQTLSSLLSFFILISCIAVGLDSKKQGIHDRMAGTYCIYT